MIQLTVALPVFNSKDILWLSLESLCRQEEINFDWELIIAEEQENAFGFNNITQYSKRLLNAGCKRVKYIPIKDWLPLGEKWTLIANSANENSKVFILQAADCYSEPKRLSKTYNEIINNNFDWVQNTKGLFFNVKTKKHILYNAVQQCGLNMATRIELIKKINLTGIKKNVDGTIFRAIRPKKVLNIDSEDFLFGVDTHGLNNISKGRENYFENEKFPFEKTDLKIDNYLPKDITQKLYSL